VIGKTNNIEDYQKTTNKSTRYDILHHMTQTITTLLSVFTVLADATIVASLLVWLINKLTGSSYGQNIVKRIQENHTILLFIIPLIATAGSLFYSEVAHYNPCRLCWFQRIFMYPQVFIAGTALVAKTRDLAAYIIPLSSAGAVIAAYHYVEQIKATLAPLDPLIPCSLDGTSCAVKYTFHFGYITIPMMALSAFLLILVIALVSRKK